MINYLLILFAALSAVALILYAADKRKARQQNYPFFAYLFYL